MPGIPDQEAAPRELVYRNLFHHDQPFRHAEAAAAMIHLVLLLLPLTADHGIVHVMLVLPAHWMQKSERLPSRFQRKAWEARQKAPQRTVHEDVGMKQKVR